MIAKLRERLLPLWQTASPRDRMLLVGLLGLGLPALLWLVVLQPLVREQQRLAKELPQLRREAAAFQRDLARVRGLRATPQAATAWPTLMAAAGLNPARVKLEPDGAGQRLTANQVDWPTWLRLVDRAAREGRQVVSLKAESAEGGMVNVEMVVR
jgi:type II secretory pathway component PulM